MYDVDALVCVCVVEYFNPVFRWEFACGTDLGAGVGGVRDEGVERGTRYFGDIVRLLVLVILKVLKWSAGLNW